MPVAFLNSLAQARRGLCWSPPRRCPTPPAG